MVDITRPYVHFYNFERPNQALTFTYGNQPPRVKFRHPPHLSPVPETIDPDRWLLTLTGKTYKRRMYKDLFYICWFDLEVSCSLEHYHD